MQYKNIERKNYKYNDIQYIQCVGGVKDKLSWCIMQIMSERNVFSLIKSGPRVTNKNILKGDHRRFLIQGYLNAGAGLYGPQLEWTGPWTDMTTVIADSNYMN